MVNDNVLIQKKKQVHTQQKSEDAFACGSLFAPTSKYLTGGDVWYNNNRVYMVYKFHTDMVF